MSQSDTKNMYQIKIKGHLKEKWIEWFNGMILEMTVSDQGGGYTTLLMQVPDQAALRGVLNKIWDLNLSLISAILKEERIRS